MLIDGYTPLKVVRPSSVAELGDLVRQAAANEHGLYPVGGGTALHLGLPPKKPGHAVETTALDQVIDYPARDMTITVQAGITLATLSATLAAENQWLPIDVPESAKATLGGAIAVNAAGSRRFGYGTLRDYVIGISFITDGGGEAKAGGRVVKNVAGYDLMKLHIGALGTLGILTQVTLKVRPRPEAFALVQVITPAPALRDLLDRLHATATRPTCIDVLPDPRGWRVAVGFEDNAASVRWQMERWIQTELRELERATLQTAEGEAAEQFWQSAWPTLNVANAVAFKATMLASAVPDFLNDAVHIGTSSGLHAHAGSGIVHGQLPAGLTLAEASRMLNELRHRAVAAQGNLLITHCPIAWKRDLPIWGAPRGDWTLMRVVKQRLDPRDLFNPGRFVI